MLPESSIVNMMFGLTGLRPWIGTSRQRLRRSRRPEPPTAASASGGGQGRGENALAGIRTGDGHGEAPVARDARPAVYFRYGLGVGHRAARTFDPHGDAVVGVAGTDQSDVVLRSGIGAERAGGEIAVAADRGTGSEAHPLDHVAAPVARVVVGDEAVRESGARAAVGAQEEIGNLRHDAVRRHAAARVAAHARVEILRRRMLRAVERRRRLPDRMDRPLDAAIHGEARRLLQHEIARDRRRRIGRAHQRDAGDRQARPSPAARRRGRCPRERSSARRRGAHADAHDGFGFMARSRARCETESWFPAPCSDSAARRRRASSPPRTVIVVQNISSGPGVTGSISYWSLRVTIAIRTARICCHVACGCSGRFAADQLPVAGCQTSTVPSLFVSRPNCAFRLTTLLTAGVAGCTVGSRLCVCSVCDAGFDRVEGLPESRGLARARRLSQIDERGHHGAVGRRRVVAGGRRQRVADRRDAGGSGDRDARRVDDRQRAVRALDRDDHVVRTEGERPGDEIRARRRRADRRRVEQRRRSRQRARAAVQHGDRIGVVVGRARIDDRRNRAQHRAAAQAPWSTPR